MLYKGFWHLVDLGIAGTTQRKRSVSLKSPNRHLLNYEQQLWPNFIEPRSDCFQAEKTEGVFQAIADVFKAVSTLTWYFEENPLY